MAGMGSLWIGYSGLSTSNNAVNVTANNITNVDTDGYVRRQVLQGDVGYTTLQQKQNGGISDIQTGLGVTIADVVHTRDMFLDQHYRAESGRQSFYGTMYETVSEVETIFQELEGEAFQETLEDLWQAFAELDKDPSSSIKQNLVVQKASLFVSRAQAASTALREYQENLNDQVKNMVADINKIGYQIYDLNDQIAKIEAGGLETAYDLRDERDMLLDELSEMTKISYKELSNGRVEVSIEGVSFVDELKVHEMDTYTDGANGYETPIWKDLSIYDTESYCEVYDMSLPIRTSMNTDIGKLKALILSRGDQVANYLYETEPENFSSITDLSPLMSSQSQLDNLVHTVVTAVNQIFSPITKISGDGVTINVVEEVTAADGTVTEVKTPLTGDVYVWDEENGNFGSDGSSPGQELFSRKYVERYTKMELEVNGEKKTYYVYNDDTGDNQYKKNDDGTIAYDSNGYPLVDTENLYTTSNLTINQNILLDETLLPYMKANGEVAHDMADQFNDMWDKGFDALGGLSFKEYYNSIINGLADVGSVYSSVSDTLTASVNSIQNQRDEVVGVSTDEELSNMIRFQSAYNASSRFITVIDEMLETIVTLI
jgi:flagellar hook-associated protein 1 FlgK